MQGAWQHASACKSVQERPFTTPLLRQDNMDKASQVLAQGVPPSVPKSYRALANYYSNISYFTLYYRARRRPSREEKARGQ